MLKIREAVSQDVPLILSFIRELAEYEREPNAVQASENDLRRDGFSEHPKFQVLIADWNYEPAGMVFYFHNYSTWQGRHGIFVEDLYVRPRFRSKGIGQALMTRLSRIAMREDCYGMRWEVLDWNKLAVDFYQGLGARFREHWQVMQLMGKELKDLSKQ